MSQPISQTQRISAVVLSISLCASTVFAYQKQQTPKASPEARPAAPLYPSPFDAAQLAALHAAQNAQNAALNHARQAALNADAAQQAAYKAQADAFTQRHSQKQAQHEAITETKQPIKTTPFNLSNRSEVHMVAVHQASCAQDDPHSCDGENGTVSVKVDYQGSPIVLILAAHNSVEWNINVTHGTKVEQVIISGHDSQHYRGLAHTIPVAMYSHESSICATNCWRGDAHRPNLYHMTRDMTELNQKILALTGKPISSLQSAHQEKLFNVYSGMPRMRY